MTTDPSAHLIKQLDAPGAVSIACGAVPRLPTGFLARAARRAAPVTLTELPAE